MEGGTCRSRASVAAQGTAKFAAFDIDSDEGDRACSILRSEDGVEALSGDQFLLDVETLKVGGRANMGEAAEADIALGLIGTE